MNHRMLLSKKRLLQVLVLSLLVPSLNTSAQEAVLEPSLKKEKKVPAK